MKTLRLKVVFILLISSLVPAQESGMDVPDRFGNIILGMSMENIKKELKADGNFNFRGDPDISILRRPDQSLIECRGYDFIERAFFQFKEDRLYSITILLNREMLDHYSLYTTLSGKYGDPDRLDPERSVWESETNILALERPLQIKYMDRKIIEGITTNGKISASLSELSREQFLEQF